MRFKAHGKLGSDLDSFQFRKVTTTNIRYSTRTVIRKTLRYRFDGLYRFFA